MYWSERRNRRYLIINLCLLSSIGGSFGQTNTIEVVLNEILASLESLQTALNTNPLMRIITIANDIVEPGVTIAAGINMILEWLNYLLERIAEHHEEKPEIHIHIALNKTKSLINGSSIYYNSNLTGKELQTLADKIGRAVHLGLNRNYMAFKNHGYFNPSLDWWPLETRVQTRHDGYRLILNIQKFVQRLFRHYLLNIYRVKNRCCRLKQEPYLMALKIYIKPLIKTMFEKLMTN